MHSWPTSRPRAAKAPKTSKGWVARRRLLREHVAALHRARDPDRRRGADLHVLAGQHLRPHGLGTRGVGPEDRRAQLPKLASNSNETRNAPSPLPVMTVSERPETCTTLPWPPPLERTVSFVPTLRPGVAVLRMNTRPAGLW